MRIQAKHWILMALVALLTGCSGETPDPTPAIQAANQKFVENFLKGDEKAVAALYTQDAKIIAPGSPIISGKAEIAKFWRGFMDAGVKDLALKTLEARASGHLAYEDGVATIIDKDGSPTAIRYLVVWKRVDGDWFLHRDIWNAGQ